MKRQELLPIARRQPFKPFELVLDNGNRYTIAHPESIWPAMHVVGVQERNGTAVLLDYRAISEVRLRSRRNGSKTSA